MKGLLIFAAIVAVLLGAIAGGIILMGAPSEAVSPVGHSASIALGFQVIVGGVCMALFWGALAAILDRLDIIQASVRKRVPVLDREHLGIGYRVTAQESEGQWQGVLSLSTEKEARRMLACATSEEAIEKADARARAVIESNSK